MKQIKVSPVIYDMIIEIAKRKNVDVDSCINTMIKNEYIKTYV